MMRYINNERLYVSRLPSLKDFERYKHLAHVRHWINVSGVDIKQIYPESALADISIAQFQFADIFTEGKGLLGFSGLEEISAGLYEHISEVQHRQAYLAAVKALIVQLENKLPTGIFCHFGMARSPLVTATALNRFHDESIAESIARVRQFHPPANFTDISVSALIWCMEQLDNQGK
jgi:predicted protein tyrosine phosphatase